MLNLEIYLVSLNYNCIYKKKYIKLYNIQCLKRNLDLKMVGVCERHVIPHFKHENDTFLHPTRLYSTDTMQVWFILE